MSDWDDDVDLDDWAEAGDASPRRWVLVLVAVVLLVPFVLTLGGGLHAYDALGPGVAAVAVFFALVAVAYFGVRRHLRNRLAPETVWSDRR